MKSQTKEIETEKSFISQVEINDGTDT